MRWLLLIQIWMLGITGISFGEEVPKRIAFYIPERFSASPVRDMLKEWDCELEAIDAATLARTGFIGATNVQGYALRSPDLAQGEPSEATMCDVTLRLGKRGLNPDQPIETRVMGLAIVRKDHQIIQHYWGGVTTDVADPAVTQSCTSFPLYLSDGATVEIAVYETSPDDHAHGRLLMYQILTYE